MLFIGIGLGGLASYFYFTSKFYIVPKAEGNKILKELEVLRLEVGEK